MYRLNPERRMESMEMKNKRGYINVEHLLSFICFALIIGLWCALSFGGMVSELFLPSPVAVAKRIVELYKDGSLLTSSLDIYLKDNHCKIVLTNV